LTWRRGAPTLALVAPDGRVITPGRAGPGAYVVRAAGSHAVALYLPAARPGLWRVRLGNLHGGEGDRFTMLGNRPQPSLSVTLPRRSQTVVASSGRSRVTVAGLLRNGDVGATVSLFYTQSRTVALRGRRTPNYAGTPLAANIPVRAGAWRYGWATHGLPAGRYYLYATLDNGTGPLVTAYGAGTVLVTRPAHRTTRPTHRATRPVRGGRSTSHRSRPHRAPAGAGSILGPRIALYLAPVGTVATGATVTAPRVSAYPAVLRLPTARRAVAVAVVALPVAKGPVQRPIFDVYDTSTPQIAYNDAAAITGIDPSTGQPARTVVGGKYVSYPGGAVAVLNYDRYYKPKKGLLSRSQKRSAAGCIPNPFRIGAKPGPANKAKTKKNKWTSCDEYPFASTVQGGSGSIVRGVTVSENRTQGGELSAFYRRYATVLKKYKGEFQVCVHIGGATYGNCDPYTFP